MPLKMYLWCICLVFCKDTLNRAAFLDEAAALLLLQWPIASHSILRAQCLVPRSL